MPSRAKQNKWCRVGYLGFFFLYIVELLILLNARHLIHCQGHFSLLTLILFVSCKFDRE
jgi:hypothetical protein